MNDTSESSDEGSADEDSTNSSDFMSLDSSERSHQGDKMDTS